MGGQCSLEPRWAASLWDARRSQVWGPARHPDIHVSFAPCSESIQGWWKRSAQHLPAAPPSQKAGGRVVQAHRMTRRSWMLPRPGSHLRPAVTCPTKVCATPRPQQGGGAGGQVSDPAQTLPCSCRPGSAQAGRGLQRSLPSRCPRCLIASVPPALSADGDVCTGDASQARPGSQRRRGSWRSPFDLPGS